MSKAYLLTYLQNAIISRLENEFKNKPLRFPEFNAEKLDDSALSEFIKSNKLNSNEIVTLLIALTPHLSPEFFNAIIYKYLPNGGEFPEFGGVKGKNHRGIIPTGETVLFILAGKNFDERTSLYQIFSEEHLFSKKNILQLELPENGEPKMSGRLVLDDDYLELFTSGKIAHPKLSSDFPAEYITTEMEWTDLVLHKKTLDEIKEIEVWLKYNDKLLNDWNLKGKIKPGFRVLFYGPPGTGKTLTACLLGKYTKRPVFRIDLSMVVSKYIGETEKNLSKLFNKAANKNWILFFDEADSIFGKRTQVRDAHDKYANQEVSYLLQRIESHAGLVILASNLKSNIDNSFTRRFNAIIEFENPDYIERQKLWNNYLPKNVTIDPEISIKEIAKNFELSGANIVNVIQFAGLKTLEKKKKIISKTDIITGIKKEYQKEGKMIVRE